MCQCLQNIIYIYDSYCETAQYSVYIKGIFQLLNREQKQSPKISTGLPHHLHFRCIPLPSVPVSGLSPSALLTSSPTADGEQRITVSPLVMTCLITPPFFSRFSSLRLSSHSLLPSFPGFGALNVDLLCF